jgi:hypothetical protein
MKEPMKLTLLGVGLVILVIAVLIGGCSDKDSATPSKSVIVSHPVHGGATMYDDINICEGDIPSREVPNGTVCTKVSGRRIVSKCGSEYGTYYQLVCDGTIGWINVNWVD